MLKFNTGTAYGKFFKKIGKNSENHIKLVRNSKNQVKNHVIWYFINATTCKIMTMRTPAVQPPILNKKFLTHLFFLNSINLRKRVKIIPRLRKPKIVKQW